MSGRVRATTLLSLCVCVGAATQLSGQQPPEVGAARVPEAKPALEDQSPVVPIDDADIPKRADLTLAALRRLEAVLRPDPRLDELESALLDRAALIIELRGSLDAIDPEVISPRRLRSERAPWLGLQGQFASWDELVSGRYVELAQERDRLRRLRGAWDETATPTNTAELPAALVRRVDTVLARLNDAEQLLRERRNAVGALLGQLVTGREAVDAALNRLDTVATRLWARTFQRNAGPLWHSLDAGPAPLAAEAVRAREAWTRSLSVSIPLQPGSFLACLAAFLLFLGLALWLRRRVASTTEHDGLSERARALIGRPFAWSSGLALAFASLVLLPSPTDSIRDLMLVVALVTMVRLGTVVLPKTSHRVLYAVVVLAALDHLASISPGGSLLDRLFLLAVSAAAFAACQHQLLVHRRQAAAVGSPERRLVIVLAGAAALLQAVALAANLFGWTELARLLTDGTIEGLLLAVGYTIAVLTIGTLAPVLLSDWLGGRLHSLRRNREIVSQTIVTTLSFLAVLLWTAGTLDAFRIYEPVAGRLTEVLAADYPFGSLTVSAGDLLAALTIVGITWVVHRLVGFFLREEVLPRLQLRRGSAQSILSLTDYTVWGMGIALAASAAGLTGTQLAVVIGALSIGIGFGLQAIVNNFVSGLILILERPIKVGDTLQLPDGWGRVERIGIRASTIRRSDGAEVIVPNGDLIAQQVVNWTGTDEIRRAEVMVGVAYGTDPERVLEILRRVADEHPRILREPEPRAHMIGFGDSSLNFRLRFWANVAGWVDVFSEVQVSVNRELKEAGITIPFPQRDLHLKSGSITDDPD